MMGAIREWIADRLNVKSNTWTVLERYLAAMGGGDSSSGVVINSTTAMQTTAVYACVKVLAESIAQLPIALYTTDGKSKTPSDGNGLLDLLRYQPNDHQTAVEFWEMMSAHLNLRGNAFAYITRASKGRVVELLPLSPDAVKVTQHGAQVVYMGAQDAGGSFAFNQGPLPDLLHIRGLTLNGYEGVSPIAYNREAIGLAIATAQHGSRLFRNGAKMGGILSHPMNLSTEAIERLRMQFDAGTSGENAHRTLVVEEGMKFEKNLHDAGRRAIFGDSEASKRADCRDFPRPAAHDRRS
jgi:HK97 family phage portal protein